MKPIHWVLGTVLLLPGFVQAELYRYVDDKGITVISRLGVPPGFVGRGYEILNDQGRVIRVVAPAPTAEEWELIQAQRIQAKNDEKLLKLYSSVEDLDLALKRKLAEIDSVISVTRGNLQSARAQRASLQSQAADYERTGADVPAHLLTQIADLQDEQDRLQREVQRYMDVQEEARTSFAADRARLVELFKSY